MSGGKLLAESMKKGIVFEALGKFVCEYAAVEAWCHVLFDTYSGLPRNVSRNIMANARLKDVIAPLLLVVEASTLSQQEKDDFSSCISHLRLITDFRHSIIHRGADIDGDQVVSSNYLTAKSEDGIEVLRFQLEHVRHAASDLTRMKLRILLLISPEPAEKLDEEEKKWLHRPWLYTHVQPDRPNQKRPNTRRAKRSLPRSSLE